MRCALQCSGMLRKSRAFASGILRILLIFHLRNAFRCEVKLEVEEELVLEQPDSITKFN